jgi:hypothetical protein
MNVKSAQKFITKNFGVLVGIVSRYPVISGLIGVGVLGYMAGTNVSERRHKEKKDA